MARNDYDDYDSYDDYNEQDYREPAPQQPHYQESGNYDESPATARIGRPQPTYQESVENDDFAEYQAFKAWQQQHAQAKKQRPRQPEPRQRPVTSHKKERERPRKPVKRREPKPRPKAKRKIKKQKKLRPARVGIRRKTTWLCWLILIASVSFGVYKNFTAINKHTIHEREVVQVKLVDTNAFETFVRDFAQIYYTWTPDHEQHDARQKQLGHYMLDSLVTLNADALRSDIPTTSAVTDVKIWQVDAGKSQTHKVLFTVTQEVTNSQDKDKKTKTINATYSVNVMKNAAGDLVIVSNPTIAAAPSKAKVAEKQTQTDSTIDSATTTSATKFLNTFFKLYPGGSANELKYYIAGGAKPINKDYRFAELINPTFHRDGDNVKVNVTAKFLDSSTDMIQYSQYTLILEKNGSNWTILSGL